MPPTTTTPWPPEPMDTRELLRTPRRWPTVTVYLTVVTILFVGLCLIGTAR
jgi:hypothetical protein